MENKRISCSGDLGAYVYGPLFTPHIFQVHPPPQPLLLYMVSVCCSNFCNYYFIGWIPKQQEKYNGKQQYLGFWGPRGGRQWTAINP